MSKNRILSLVLALVMVLGAFGTVFADTVSPAKTQEAAAFLKAEGLLSGNAAGDLMLDEELKRRDSVIMLAVLLGELDTAKEFAGEPTFTDIKNEDGSFKDAFYVPFLKWAEENEYYVGRPNGEFGWDANLTAQEYSKVLLVALGYTVNGEGSDVKWEEATKKAADLGVFKGFEKVEETKEILRGEMALMTFNALGIKIKGTEQTLAAKLGIELPEADKPTELKVEKVYTENLAEIVVELSNAKLVDEEKLEDANNYKLTGFSIVKAEVQENNVVLSLKKDTSLVKGRKYDLLVRGLGKDLNKKYNFTAEDNTIPAVESVEVLGEYGIRVTTTEPVKNPLERNFLIDGKNVAMEVEQYGREIILTPYHKASFDLKAEKLTVKELVDYEGYKSVEKDFEIEVKKDEEAPKVIDVIANNKEVKVIFDKDIYNNSVDAYYSRVSVGNVSYEAGRHPVYAEKAEKVDTNEVVYTFKDELPRRTIVTIVDVSNHSKVEMEKTTEEARIVLDNIEPEIIDHKVRKQSDSSVKIELYFDKDVKGNFVANSDTEFVAKDHFALYEAEVLKRNILEDKITKAEYAKDREDVVIVTIVDLQLNNKDKDYNYILEIVDFKDMSSNKMYRDYVDFDIKAAASAFKVVDVVVKENRADTEVTVFFNKAVDRTIAEDLTNYIFRYDNAAQTRYDVKDLDGKIITERNGNEVTIVLPDFNKNNFKSLEILETIKDKDGNRVAPSSRYVFGTNFDVFVARAEAASTKGAALSIDADTLTTLTNLAPYTNSSKHYEILKAVEAVEKLIDKAEEAVDGKVAVAKKALQSKIAVAEGIYATTIATNTKAALAVRIADSKLVLTTGTEAQINTSAVLLQDAIDAVVAEADLLAARNTLAADVLVAQGLHDASTEGVVAGNNIVGSKTTFQSAITTLAGVGTNPSSTLAQVEAAINNLATAVNVFNTAIVADISSNLIAPALEFGVTNSGTITGVVIVPGETLNVTSSAAVVSVDAVTGLDLTATDAGTATITVQVLVGANVVKTGTVEVIVD